MKTQQARKTEEHQKLYTLLQRMERKGKVYLTEAGKERIKERLHGR